MSIKIQVPEFKGFKLIKTPEAQSAIDLVITKKWWNDQGWSTMYDLTYQELIDSDFTDQDIISMKSDKLMLEYKLWKKETVQ